MTSASLGYSARPFVRDTTTWLGYSAFAFLLFLEAALGSAMPSIRADLGLSYTLAGLHFSVLATAAAVTGLFGDRVARRWGRQLTCWIGLAGLAVGGASIALIPLVAGTLLGALVIGWAGMLVAIVVQAHLAEHHGEQRTVALAEVNLAASSGAIAASLAVGLFVRSPFGWRGAFLAGIACAAAAGWLLRHARLGGAIPPMAGRRAARLPGAFWLTCVVAALSAAAEWSVAYWGADFLHERIAISRSSAAIALSLFFIAMAAGRFAGSRLARNVDAGRLLVGSLAVALCGSVGFRLAPSIVLGLVALVVLGLGLANVFPTAASLATGLAPGRADAALARMLMISSLAILAAPLILGVLGDEVGIERGFGITIPILGVAMAAGALLQRRSAVAA